MQREQFQNMKLSKKLACFIHSELIVKSTDIKIE